MRRLARLASPVALAFAFAATPAHAQPKGGYSASFDRAATPPARALRAPRGPAARPALPVFSSATDARRGVPSFLWAARGAFAPPIAGARPEDAARAHLGRIAGLYDLPPTAVASAVALFVVVVALVWGRAGGGRKREGRHRRGITAWTAGLPRGLSRTPLRRPGREAS